VQIREIIEYKYSSPHQKYAATIRKEKRKFLYFILANQERNTKISRTLPRLRVCR
jgi:hypothetical protein